MPLLSETIAIPVTKGVDLRTASRLVQPPSLLEAKNAQFGRGGSAKRYGHTINRIRSGVYPPAVTQFQINKPELTPYGEKVLDSDWLFGWGLMTSNQRNLPYTTDDSSDYPEPGYVFGMTQRDSELLAWTGHSLISYASSQDVSGSYGKISRAIVPALRSQPIAKTQTNQETPEAADNGEIRVIAWRTTVSGASQVYYSVYDSASGAPLITAKSLGMVDAEHFRLTFLGSTFHIIVWENDTDTLHVKTFTQSSLSSIASRSLGSCNGIFDVFKLDETKLCVAKCVGAGGATTVELKWVGPTGAAPADELELQLLDNTDAEHKELSICIHPVTGHIGLAVRCNPVSDTLRVYIFSRDGVTFSVAHDIFSFTNANNCRLSITPRYLVGITGEDNPGIFDVYFSWANTNSVETYCFTYDEDDFVQKAAKHHIRIVSQAFRVGERTFVWGANTSTLQSMWFLLDETLSPVGRLNFSTAHTPSDTTGLCPLRSVNYKLYNTPKDQMVFHLALGYRVRVPTTSDQIALYTEPSIQFVEIDFLPSIRTAQAGRSTYFAGAQLWSYDGKEIVEQGFHVCPEVTLTGAAGGALTSAGTYSYRIDLCHKNAQGEEVRSHSLLTQITLGAQQTVNLSIKTCLTSRTDSYFLIFRNAMIAGAPTTTWNLINSRDPTSAEFKANNQASAFVTYADAGAVSDSVGLSRETHPANSTTFLHPFSGQASEVVAAGRDRLWLAGGEIPFGQVSPSRLFFPGETPAFNANINIQIDRNEQPITGIGFVGDIAAIFREHSTYILEGDGPDNQANGFWPSARLAIADSGAQTQESIALINEGLTFQSPAGFRLIGPGGSMVVIGAAVDSFARDFKIRSVAVFPSTTEVRWYGADSTIVYNYLEDAWSEWTCSAMGAVRVPADDTAALVTYDGFFLLETPNYYRDGDKPYEHRLRFPWLHAGNLGDFQRIRTFSGMGEWDPNFPHSVRVECYYDERNFYEEVFEWSVPDNTQNDDTFGTLTFGSGVFGDTSQQEETAAHAQLNIEDMEIPTDSGFADGLFAWNVGGIEGNGKLIKYSITDAIGPSAIEARLDAFYDVLTDTWTDETGTIGVVVYESNVAGLTDDDMIDEIIAAGAPVTLSAYGANKLLTYPGDPTMFTGAFSGGEEFNLALPIRDSVWRWTRGPHRQKCSVFSVAISDAQSDGPGFKMVALGLEIAKKPGLDRTPHSAVTSTHR